MRQTKLAIECTWSGEALELSERASVALSLAGDQLVVDVDSPFYDDPPPTADPGSFDGLWDYEVVELFLLGDDERYLELELSPHGHYLVLQLHGRRRVASSGSSLDLRCEILGQRWRGSARLPVTLLPPGLHALNAYAIHGRDDQRRYHAAAPVAGPEPDFHRLECFRVLDW